MRMLLWRAVAAMPPVQKQWLMHSLLLTVTLFVRDSYFPSILCTRHGFMQSNHVDDLGEEVYHRYLHGEFVMKGPAVFSELLISIFSPFSSRISLSTSTVAIMS